MSVARESDQKDIELTKVGMMTDKGHNPERRKVTPTKINSYATVMLPSYCTTGVAPATALFGRAIRTRLPNPVAVPSGESHYPLTMSERDAHQKLMIKS